MHASCPEQTTHSASTKENYTFKRAYFALIRLYILAVISTSVGDSNCSHAEDRACSGHAW